MKTLHTHKNLIFAMLFALLVAQPAFAGSYWYSFKAYWTRVISSQNGYVMFALGMGAIGIFIISRGKWKK
ncbi:MAG: hypothetical protein R3B84_03900 [Zavarzinella sp.]